MPSYTWRCLLTFWRNSLDRLESTKLETNILGSGIFLFLKLKLINTTSNNEILCFVINFLLMFSKTKPKF